MNITIYPGRLSGRVTVPASKSAAHRALIGAALGDGQIGLGINRLNADLRATIDCLQRLGMASDYFDEDGILAIQPIPSAPNLARALTSCLGCPIASTVDFDRVIELDCGESGSTLRFMLPVVCALGVKARFVGRGRLPERPNAALVEALRAHGASIDSDRLPMNVSGALTGGVYTLPGNVSSQYITGLLFALPLLSEDSEIRLTTPLESAAYVDMTLDMLARFGIAVEADSAGWRVPGGQRYHLAGAGRGLTVEGDWSAAAFWLAANAMGSEVEVRGLSDATAQGDRAVLRLLGQREIDASGVPDLVPALAAAAAVLPQTTIITGAARLRLKESDRLRAVADMIGTLGGRVRVKADGLIIDGGLPLHAGAIDGANDHRIVMAGAILALSAEGPVTITGAEAVSKSYPDFFEHFKSLGGKCDEQPAGR